jgi:translation elongation factor EF-Ts
MKELETKKMAIQEKLMQSDVEEKEVEKEQLRAQMEIEKNLLLVRMQVLEKQQEMRNKNNSHLNDKLDELFKE